VCTKYYIVWEVLVFYEKCSSFVDSISLYVEGSDELKVSVKMNVEDDFHSIFQSLNSLISDVGRLHLKPNIKVTIKPNLCALKPSETGATTDVKVVEALVKIIKRKEPTAKIYIVESDTHIRDTWKAFEILGFLRLREKYGVELINLSEEELVEVNIVDGHFFQKMYVPKILIGEKLLISVAKLKTHSSEKMSCSLKNLFGLLPEKKQVHLSSALKQSPLRHHENI